MQKQKSKTGIRWLISGLLFLAGCYPGEVDSVEELDLVTTLFDKNADFSAYKTYAITDTIIHICDLNQAEQDCPSELTRLFDQQIIAQVRTNLADLGFTETDSASADVFVLLAANATDVYGYSYYYWYWDYWYGYPPGWGWYYPPTTVVYEFTTGTLMINMFDPDKADTGNKHIKAVWVAAINGLIGEGGNAQNRISSTINQAFEQSTYLGAGK